MSTELKPVAMFGKSPSGDEFRLWARPGDAVDAALAAPAGDWLGLLLQGGNQAVCAIQRIAGRWWLFRTEPDPHPDANGRPTGFVLIAGLPELPPARLAGVLLQAVQVPVRRDELPRALPGAEVAPARSPGAVAAALALATGAPAVAAGFDEAAAVLATGVAVEWLAFLPNRYPPGPGATAGPGLAISKDKTAFPHEHARLIERYGSDAVRALPLAELGATALPPAHRLQLVAAALGDATARAGLAVDPVAAEWLARTAPGRAAAVPALTADGIDWWFASGPARAEDAITLASKLAPRHRPAVNRLLRARPRAHADYLSVFPDDRTGAVELLPAAERSTWDRLAEPNRVAPAAPEVEQLLAALEGTPLGLSLTQLANAAVTGSERARAMFLDALVAEGVPQPTATALLSGGEIPTPGTPPQLRPTAEWLNAVPAVNWLTAWRSMTDQNWRRWWLEGVAVLLAAGRIGLPEVCEEAVRAGASDLLRACGASNSLVEFVAGTDPVRLPPDDGPWPTAANELLAAQLRDGTLFARVVGPIGANLFEWLAGRGDRFAPARAILDAIPKGEPADAKLLLAAAPVLAREWVLGQTAAWGVARGSAQRSAVLTALFDAPSLKAEEADWLRTLLLRCAALPPCPHWSAAELTVLLPILDPVRDVVRQIIGRPERDPSEVALLVQLQPRLARARPAPGTFPEVAYQLRPDWVAALAAVPGWEDAAGPNAALAALSTTAIAARARWGDALPESVRLAIGLLTEGRPE